MNLPRREPDIFDRLQNEINRLFDFDFSPSREGFFGRDITPTMDVREEDNAFIVTCELPGVDKKDVDVSVSSNILTISGEKSGEEEKKGHKWYRRESWSGKFQRNFTLPSGADAENINANMKNGVLTVTVPKKEESKPKQIDVKVS